jgi:hypothetical protein
MPDHLTTGQLATFFNLPIWKVRRAVDSLPGELPRAGMYRMVPRSRLGELAVVMQERGWLGDTEGVVDEPQARIPEGATLGFAESGV